MSAINFSLAVDFPNGLLNHMLQTAINDNGMIAPNCVKIDTVGDVVRIEFDAALSPTESVELDDMVANYVYEIPADSPVTGPIFQMSNVLDNFETWALNGLTLSSGVVTPIANMTKTSGNLGSFDGSIIVPEENGIYLYNVLICSPDANGNTDLKIRVIDGNTSDVVFGTDQRLNQIGNCYAFLGNGQYILTTTPLSFTLEVDTNNFTCDIVFKLLKFML